MTGREELERLLELEHEDMITDADRVKLEALLDQSGEYRLLRQEYRLARIGLRDAPQVEPGEAEVSSFKRRLRLKLEDGKQAQREPKLTFSWLTRTMSYAAAALAVLVILVINIPSDTGVQNDPKTPYETEVDEAEVLLTDLFAAHDEATLVDMVPVTEAGDLSGLFTEDDG